MNTIQTANIEQAAYNIMTRAAIDIPEDYRESIAGMAGREENPLSCFVLQTMIDRHGKEVPLAEANILPAALTWEVGVTILFAVLGFVLIWQLTAWAERREKPE